MSRINNQSKPLYNIEAVIDINQESAAAISGGAAVTLYSKPNKKGFRFSSNKAIKDLSKFGFNDTTGSITVANNQTWRFYSDANFKGTRVIVRPGQTVNNAGDFGMKISSFRALK